MGHIKAFKIVRGRTPEGLEKKVEALIGKGGHRETWELHGFMSILPGKKPLLCQPMIKVWHSPSSSD